MNGKPLSKTTWKSLVPRSADYIFLLVVLCVLFQKQGDVLNDPGLGWHLRTADLIWETGNFAYEEQFCLPSIGDPWVAYSWFGDFIMRGCDLWGSLNGIAILTAIVFGFAARILFVQMTRSGTPWLLATFWTFVAILGTRPAWTARPNMFTFVGLAVTVSICSQFHTGKIERKQTLWLLPVFLIWTNSHSGFLSGALVLTVTYLCECSIAFLGHREIRAQAMHRVKWWTVLGLALFLVTLLNPNGVHLYTHLVGMVGDEFVMRNTTTEWLPPDFAHPGWGIVELVVLLAFVLPVISDRQMNLVGFVLMIVFLHFALTGRRYTPLWVVISIPVLANLSLGIRGLTNLKNWLIENTSEQFRKRFREPASDSSSYASVLFAGILLFTSPWWPNIVKHDPRKIPEAGLNHLLKNYSGETVFHSVNWGGYLTWHGWDLEPRFKTWIDDRLETHSHEHWEEYKDLMLAKPGYETTLDHRGIELLCLPAKSALAQHIDRNGRWNREYKDGDVMIFRKKMETLHVEQKSRM